jgi:hypothetical protein
MRLHTQAAALLMLLCCSGMILADAVLPEAGDR